MEDNIEDDEDGAKEDVEDGAKAKECVDDQEEEEDQWVAYLLEFPPILNIQAVITLGEADLKHFCNDSCLECHDCYLNEYEYVRYDSLSVFEICERVMLPGWCQE